MTRYRWKTAAALLGLGLFCGCAMTTNSCGEQQPREGLFSRWFGQHQRPNCECVETGRVIVGDGPVIPEPGCVESGVLPPGAFTPGVPTMPPPTALPTPNPLAQPIPANPSSQVKNAGK